MQGRQEQRQASSTERYQHVRSHPRPSLPVAAPSRRRCRHAGLPGSCCAAVAHCRYWNRHCAARCAVQRQAARAWDLGCCAGLVAATASGAALLGRNLCGLGTACGRSPGPHPSSLAMGPCPAAAVARSCGPSAAGRHRAAAGPAAADPTVAGLVGHGPPASHHLAHVEALRHAPSHAAHRGRATLICPSLGGARAAASCHRRHCHCGALVEVVCVATTGSCYASSTACRLAASPAPPCAVQTARSPLETGGRRS